MKYLKTQDKEYRKEYNKKYYKTYTKTHKEEKRLYDLKYQKQKKKVEFDRTTKIIKIQDKEFKYNAFSILNDCIKIYNRWELIINL